MGLKFLRTMFVLGGMAVFAGMNAWFLWEIWDESGTGQASLNEQAVYAASAVGGVLGTFFAGVLGINAVTASGAKFGEMLLPGVSRGELLGAIAIWLYAAVGTAAVATVFFNQDQSPDSIKALASVFAGFGLAVFIAAFSPQVGGIAGSANPSEGPNRD